MRILVVEDEIPLAEAVSHILKKQNYSVDMVHDGESGLDSALSRIYDLIILDIMLPKMNGLTVLKHIRRENILTPVLLLTAKGEIEDRVVGLDSGADDYLPKPFATEELLARIRALSRRKGEVIATDELKFGDIVLNHDALLLTNKDKEIKLTLREADLLEFLILRNGLIASKELIIEKLWGFDSEAEHNNVEVYISFLRKKLTYLKFYTTITTTRGVGYALEVKV
ncbi:response regulator transcription factor [Clostridium grantii]|uniref:Stage 0 sporulation protein A homolog n=1 Tax=Clostridium grantii DSM 8605 TaxID=1121316 RepID=A0A1M5V737_9CLOT|nr:response regulator transcription factor [Clostridium grantii]SHH70894.1 DNA-binding response regulator, OmpR family, contains REC and winged-helix (wHTH) domain [Clostridium grantii DSM 8605]